MKQKQNLDRETSKQNMKLYPIYLMFGYDLLFFYSIKVLFFSEIKGLTDSQILLSSAIYAIFTIFLQFPTSVLVTKTGRRNTMILGNIINIFSVIIFITLKSFGGLVLGQIFSAIAFALKSISESNLLTISIPETERAQEIFTNIDRRGYARYCLFSAFSSVTGGLLFQINGYLPMYFCLICAIIATVLSFNFEEIEYKSKEKITLKSYVKELRQGYKFTINSKRLRALLLSTGAIWGILSLIDTYQLALLQNIGTPSIIIGFVFAIYELSKAVFSRGAIIFNEKFRNRSLTNILLMFSFSLILCGIVSIFNIPIIFKLLFIVIFIIMMGAMNGISQILSKKYLNSFTSEKILTCIYSAKSISDNFSKMIITGVGSLILAVSNINHATIIVGLLMLLLTFFLFSYMNGKLGLKPDEYTKKDIYIKK